MDRAILVRAASLYVPIMLALLISLHRPPSRRQVASMLVAFVWCLPALLLLQLINQLFHFWAFHAVGGLIRGMPVDLYLGWALAWSAIPCLTLRRQPIWLMVTVMFTLDVLAMPLCEPVVELSSRWLLGESLAMALVLLPAQLFARWTSEDSNLAGRATLHVVSSGGVILFLLPESIFALLHQPGWQQLWQQSAYSVSLQLQALALLGLLGVTAVQEFALRGEGTPIPYDPPKKLVTTGIYAYIANPMQLSCAMVMTALGAVLANPWILATGVMSFVYGFGLADWDEAADMQARFGESWLRYRGQVKAWRFRWRPYYGAARPARIYVAENCGPCSEVRRWFAARKPVGLEILAAEVHPARDLQRVTYEPADGSRPEEGIAAFARALDHVNLAWTLLGALIRLPIIRPALQLLVDASGLGPRRIPRRSLQCELVE